MLGATDPGPILKDLGVTQQGARRREPMRKNLKEKLCEFNDELASKTCLPSNCYVLIDEGLKFSTSKKKKRVSNATTENLKRRTFEF